MSDSSSPNPDDNDALSELSQMIDGQQEELKDASIPHYDDDHRFAAGFTQRELDISIKVLSLLNDNAKLCLKPEYEGLKKSVMKMMAHWDKGRYAGLTRHEYRRRLEERREKQSKISKLKHHDRQHINTSKLRSDRIDTLNRLIEPQIPFLREKVGLLTGPTSNSRLLLTDGNNIETRDASNEVKDTITIAASSSSPSPSPSPPVIEDGDNNEDSNAPMSADGIGSVVSARDEARRKVELKEVERLRRKKLVVDNPPSLPNPTIFSSSSSSFSSSQPKKGRAPKPPRAKKVAQQNNNNESSSSTSTSFSSSVPVPSPPPSSSSSSSMSSPPPPVAASGGLRGRGGENDAPQILNFPRSCYVCKKRFLELHFFYDQLCPPCAKLNWSKRNQVADLKGKVILLTGSRVKIGYYSGLKLLRCGATLIATSRFPHDTARRYSLEHDFNQWKERLHVYGLDLRDLRSVVRFTDMIAHKYKRLDGIVNNAAQTVRRPPAYYRHLIPLEMKKTNDLTPDIQSCIRGDPHRDDSVPAYIRLTQSTPSFSSSIPSSSTSTSSAPLSSPPSSNNETKTIPSSSLPSSSSHPSSKGVTIIEVTKEEEIENDDSRHHASSSSVISSSSSMNDIGEIMSSVMSDGGSISAAMSQMIVSPGDEIVDGKLFPEGHFDVTGQQLDLRRVNSWLLLLDQIDPSELLEVFAINALAPFIINSRLKRLMLVDPTGAKYIINVSAMEGKFYRFKGPQHPHTNMAKAALNMMTRTSAQDYAADNIYMNSVDTGWINDENPFEIQREIASTNFQTPIDEEDAMARILDPILDGYNTGNNPWGKFFKDYNESEW